MPLISPLMPVPHQYFLFQGEKINKLLSVLMAIFPGGPALADTRMSLFWILLVLRMIYSYWCKPEKKEEEEGGGRRRQRQCQLQHVQH